MNCMIRTNDNKSKTELNINLIYTANKEAEFNVFGKQFVQNNKKNYIKLFINDEKCYFNK